MDKLEFSIKTSENDRVFVDDYSEDGVWLSLAVRGGSMFTVLSKEQAQELIAALQQVIA